jgi:hypothetical protein
MQELTLPEWAFLDACSHLGNQLVQRIVILHIRSMTVIEVFSREDVLLSSDTLYISFKNLNTGEQLIAALHFSTTLDKNNDRGFLIEILKKCASWYCDYCDWRDAEGF